MVVFRVQGIFHRRTQLQLLTSKQTKELHGKYTLTGRAYCSGIVEWNIYLSVLRGSIRRVLPSTWWQK